MRKGLKHIPGVGDATIHIDDGRAELILIEGHPLDLDVIEETIKKGGYTPRDIWIEATGRIELWNGQPAFVILENEAKFLLTEDETFQRLNRLLAGQKGRAVRIWGKLEKQMPAGHHGHPHTLTLERFEIR